jgi:peroxin-19
MSSTQPTVEKVNSDGEDDLDDLDDVLTQFSPAPGEHKGRPRTNTRVGEPPKSIAGSGTALPSTAEEGEDEFTKELARGMELLMQELVNNAPGAEGDAAAGEEMSPEQKQQLKAAWEALLVEEMDGKLGDGGVEGIASGQTKGVEGGGTFQDTIKQTMSKMRENESKIKGAEGSSGAAGGDAEALEQLLSSLGDLGLGGDDKDDPELAGFIENMMAQLMSKEILLEPLQELAESFPKYLADPTKTISAEDRERYDKQLVCVKQILVVFEKPTYDDANAEDKAKILELMNEMQSYGTPPTEVMGNLPPGLDGTGIPGLGDENCIIA